ncbi:hypothetical protein IFM89_009076 [Coptis chinensis]|uniref:Thiolase C-terminal domain-containing protein n=1 Tax=Coptis chinensis TaxID=261450 RepID=A0A835MAE9_9MAGN|nr:hypothetical protein IFM89_009076 [Coptis chinensis]
MDKAPPASAFDIFVINAPPKSTNEPTTSVQVLEKQGNEGHQVQSPLVQNEVAVTPPHSTLNVSPTNAFTPFQPSRRKLAQRNRRERELISGRSSKRTRRNLEAGLQNILVSMSSHMYLGHDFCWRCHDLQECGMSSWRAYHTSNISDMRAYHTSNISDITQNVDPKTGEEKPITVAVDDSIRPSTTVSDLGKLKPEFCCCGSGSCRGPAVAIPAAVKSTGLELDDIDLFEINDAFASQFVYCRKKLEIDLAKVNVNGVLWLLDILWVQQVLGITYHLAESTRCVTTLLHEMKRQGKDCRFGVISMCIGLLLSFQLSCS